MPEPAPARKAEEIFKRLPDLSPWDTETLRGLFFQLGRVSRESSGLDDLIARAAVRGYMGERDEAVADALAAYHRLEPALDSSTFNVFTALAHLGRVHEARRLAWHLVELGVLTTPRETGAIWLAAVLSGDLGLLDRILEGQGNLPGALKEHCLNHPGFRAAFEAFGKQLEVHFAENIVESAFELGGDEDAVPTLSMDIRVQLDRAERRRRRDLVYRAALDAAARAGYDEDVLTPYFVLTVWPGPMPDDKAA